MSLRKDGPIRRWLEGKPLLSGSLIAPSSGELVDGDVDAFKRKTVEEWKAKGVPDGMANYGIKLAEDYAQGMVEFLLPNDAESQKKALPNLFKTSVEKVSAPWLKGVYKAMTGKELIL